MTPSWEKIKCALTASRRLQPERSLLLLMGLKEVFQSAETRLLPPPPPSLFLSPLFRVWNHIQRGGGGRAEQGRAHPLDCQSWSLLTLSKRTINTLSSQQPRKITRSLNRSNLKCRIVLSRRQAGKWLGLWVLPHAESGEASSLN